MSSVVRLGEEPDFEKRLRIEWGESLAEHLEAAGMTRKQLQREMADRGLEVSEQSMSQWITGQVMPKPHTQAVIAGVFGVPVRRLFPIEAVA